MDNSRNKDEEITPNVNNDNNKSLIQLYGRLAPYTIILVLCLYFA